jgi:hypothetical protein
MGITDFINWIKRESRYGGSPLISNSNTDQPTLDILTSLNARRKRIWRKPGNWRWFVEQIQFNVVAGQYVYPVTAKSGNRIDRIQDLWPVDLTVTPNAYGLPFKQRTPRQFAQDVVRNSIPKDYSGIYKNIGLDSTGKWTVELALCPAAPFTMGGEAKGVLNTFLIGDVTGIGPFSVGNVAQAPNATLDYFPDGVIEDVLFEGVMADVALIQGNEASHDAKDGAFETKIKMLAAEETDAAKDNTPIQRPLPMLVRRRMSRRCRSSRW